MPIDLSQPGDYYLDSYIAYVVNGVRLGASCIQIQDFTIYDLTGTGIDETVDDESAKGKWYDLDGRQLSGKPTSKGVYMFKVGNRLTKKIVVSGKP